VLAAVVLMVSASSPVSTANAGEDGVIALGGGVFVPPAANFATGATVTISNSVITGNTAAPTTSVDAGFSCGIQDCQFAQAGGGRDRQLGHPDGCQHDRQQQQVGRNIHQRRRRSGHLHPAGRPYREQQRRDREPDDRDRSSLSNNTLPSSVGVQSGMNANAGGIHVGDGIPTTVKNTAITGNSATATDTQGEPISIDAGVIVGTAHSSCGTLRSTTTWRRPGR
jgi:hypothetical protein